MGYKADGFSFIISMFKDLMVFKRLVGKIFLDLTFNWIDLFGHLFLKANAISSPANPAPIIKNGFADESSLYISWPTINSRDLAKGLIGTAKSLSFLIKCSESILVFVPIFRDSEEYSISGRPFKSNFFS